MVWCGMICRFTRRVLWHCRFVGSCLSWWRVAVFAWFWGFAAVFAVSCFCFLGLRPVICWIATWLTVSVCRATKEIAVRLCGVGDVGIVSLVVVRVIRLIFTVVLCLVGVCFPGSFWAHCVVLHLCAFVVLITGLLCRLLRLDCLGFTTG